MKRIKVLLVDDHTIVREGMRKLLEEEPAVEVVGEAANGEEALRLAPTSQAEVIVMDLALPRMNGLETTRNIRRVLPSAKVLVVSSYMDGESVAAALKAGAAGYLEKHSAGEELLQAIRETYMGRPFFSRRILERMERQKRRQGGFVPNRLSRREVEVLQRIAEGFSNREIADDLGISIKTVEKHRQKVMDKLDIHEAAGLTRFAIEHRVIEANGRAAKSE